MEDQANRLIYEKSPYLLQHAYNPVDWYPWGDEAFQKARGENKPIFLSIGYSTCHWCHVMEEESFENEETAALLNKHFVSIKVDREERPDIDHVYMQAVMALSGAGGWPMSVFLTPDQKPFYGGTYFPPQDMHGRPGFKTVLSAIATKWANERDQIVRSSDQITKALNDEAKISGDGAPDLNEEILTKAFESFQMQYDKAFSGFGGAPKFPRSHVMSFLLRYWKRTGNEKALEMSEATLKAMAYGGMYDHLGGGFHRYSTDAEWHVPHFEKMLYDQALITKTFLEVYQITKDPYYAETVADVFHYLKTKMTDESGAFYSAEDADSAEHFSEPEKKKEGVFYVWEAGEIKKILKPDEFKVFSFIFDVKENGNASFDPHAEFERKNILRRIKSNEEAAKEFQKASSEIKTMIQAASDKLYAVREKRMKPHLDDKILTDWNALMISSLTQAGMILKEPEYLKRAETAVNFILTQMKTEEGRLLHRYRKGEANVPGFLEDYAFLSQALLDLYEATYKEVYLKEALFFIEEMVRLFWDKTHGGFYFTGRDTEALITEAKEIYDGAIPSGNSVAALTLLRAARLTFDKNLEEKGDRLFSTFSHKLTKFPAGYPQLLIAFDFFLGPTREIVIAAPSVTSEVREAQRLFYDVFSPNQVVLLNPENEKALIKEKVPFLEKQNMIEGNVTYYVCTNFVCDLPLTDIKKLEEKLRGK